MELLLQAWNLLQVPLGIGIVIFVHEAGHFLAARACGVRVDVFSQCLHAVQRLAARQHARAHSIAELLEAPCLALTAFQVVTAGAGLEGNTGRSGD